MLVTSLLIVLALHLENVENENPDERFSAFSVFYFFIYFDSGKIFSLLYKVQERADAFLLLDEMHCK